MLTTERIEKEMQNSARLDETEIYCQICYTNVIADKNEVNSPETTISFSCEHQFCKDCVVEQFKSLIKDAKIDKITCLDFDCRKPINEDAIRNVLADQPDYLEKYERFKKAKELEADPLVRYCPKAGCSEYMKADSNETEKLQCLSCKTWVCFRCRDVWHEDVSCKEAMNSQLKGWAEENKDNVSMCPMCNTRIEKNKGCNHMTCAFCEYEFCWACGASATIKENHYGPGRGCGVSLMEENVKPNSHL